MPYINEFDKLLCVQVGSFSMEAKLVTAEIMMISIMLSNTASSQSNGHLDM